jgi:hypothetical protein
MAQTEQDIPQAKTTRVGILLETSKGRLAIWLNRQDCAPFHRRQHPLAVAALTQVGPGWAAYISVLNALLVCVDILGAGIVLFQIAPTAVVHNQGWCTYWRKDKKGLLA